MAYQGVLEDIQRAVELKTPSRVPVFAISEPFDVKWAKLTHRQYTDDPETMAQCRIGAVRQFDYDWSCGWPDDYLEFEPLGVSLARGGDDTPLAPCGYPEPSAATLRRLSLPNFQRDKRLPGYLGVLNKIRSRFGDGLCLTGRIAGPFTAVALFYGVESALNLLCEDLGLFDAHMDFFADLAIAWGRAQLQAGAYALWLGDCVAGSGFISPARYRSTVFDRTRRVVEALRSDGAFVFYHAGESALPHLELMADLGPSGLSIGGKLDLSQAKATVGKRVCLLGNIQGLTVLQRGSFRLVEQETRRILEAGMPGGGYIFNSEEGIPRETPPENIRAMVETVRTFGRYSS